MFKLLDRWNIQWYPKHWTWFCVHLNRKPMVSVIQYFLLYYRPRKPSSEALYYYTLLFNFHSIENLIPMNRQLENAVWIDLWNLQCTRDKQSWCPNKMYNKLNLTDQYFVIDLMLISSLLNRREIHFRSSYNS